MDDNNCTRGRSEILFLRSPRSQCCLAALHRGSCDADADFTARRTSHDSGRPCMLMIMVLQTEHACKRKHAPAQPVPLKMRVPGLMLCGAVLRLSRVHFSFCFSSLLNILFRHLLPSPSFFFSSFFLLSKGGEKEHGFVLNVQSRKSHFASTERRAWRRHNSRPLKYD